MLSGTDRDYPPSSLLPIKTYARLKDPTLLTPQHQPGALGDDKMAQKTGMLPNLAT